MGCSLGRWDPPGTLSYEQLQRNSLSSHPCDGHRGPWEQVDRGKSRDMGSSVFWGTVQRGGRRMGLGARQRVHLAALTS